MIEFHQKKNKTSSTMASRIITILSAIILSATASQAQSDSTQLWASERKVAEIMDKCLKASDDPHKTAYATEAANELEYLLNMPLAYNYALPYIKNISSAESADGRVRVITFGIQLTANKYIYHGFVMHNDDGDITVTRLKQGKRPERDPMNANMQSDNWFGAIYYEIATFGPANSPIYALCGWDGADMYTNRKVLEQMNFDEDNTPIFGGLFQTEKGNGFSRIVFTFNEKAVMSLRYNKKMKMITGDYLALPRGMPIQLKDNERYFGPDGSCNGYFYKNGTWHLIQDVEVKWDDK